MAGEWLKFEASTPEKPEVFAITVAMGWDDPDLTVGKLLKVWRWFDQQTINGNAPNVTLALLDKISGVSGFAKAMCDQQWLLQSDAGLSLPNFDRHNGKTAKDRCLTAKRVAKHKTNASGNGAGVTSALPREEKRREEKKEDKEQTTCAAAPAAVVEVAPALPAEPAEPPAYTLPTNTGEECPIARQRVEEFVELYPGVDVMQELRKMRGWLISNPAKRKTKKGMMSFVNNWLSKQQNAAGSQQQLRRIGPASGRPSINNIGVAPGADDDIFNQMRTEL